MIFGVLLVDTFRKFRKKPGFCVKNYIYQLSKILRYIYQGGVDPPKYPCPLCPSNVRPCLRAAKIFGVFALGYPL